MKYEQDILSYNLAAYSPASVLTNSIVENEYDTTAWEEMPDEMYAKALVESDWFHSTGVDIPDDATDADVSVIAMASRSLHSSDAWIRGDIVEWVRKHKFNGGKIPETVMQQLAKQMGVNSLSKLRNNANTSASWPFALRFPPSQMSYSHHAELNGKSPEEKMEWAERVIAEGMTIVALRDALTNDSITVVGNNGNGVASPTPTKFASDVFDVETAMDVLAIDLQNKSMEACKTVLMNYWKSHLIKFPPSYWVASMPSIFTGTQAAEEEDDA